MSGYCSSGRRGSPPMPASMMTIASTQAKIGRSMKMRDRASRLAAGRLPAACRLACRGTIFCGALGRHRLQRRARLQIGRSLGDDLVARLEARGHDPVGAEVRSASTAALPPCCPCRRRTRRPRRRCRAERRLRDEERAVSTAWAKAPARTCRAAARPAGWENARAASPCRCSRSTIDFGELDRAGVAVVAAVLELQPHLRAAGGATPPARERAPEREQVGARLLDVDVDRVEPLDDGQRIGLVGGDEAPTVNSDRPMRPLIGAGTVVKRRLIRAVSSAALFWATAARAWRACAAASV